MGTYMASQSSPAVRIDPTTGQKLFNTRADKASDRVVGKGYDVVTDATDDPASEQLTRRLITDLPVLIQ